MDRALSHWIVQHGWTRYAFMHTVYWQIQVGSETNLLSNTCFHSLHVLFHFTIKLIHMLCMLFTCPEKKKDNNVYTCHALDISIVFAHYLPRKKNRGTIYLIQSWKLSTVHCTLTHYFQYSQTSLTRTPKGQNQVSALQRCLYYRGRECMIFGISGTKRTVCNREVSVLERCL